FGATLTIVDGERWHRQRRLMAPAFQPRSLAHASSVITGATAEMLERWQGIAERGETVDVSREMTELTRRIIAKLGLGDADAATLRGRGKAVDEALRHASGRLWSPLGSLEIPTPAHRRFLAALQTLDGIVSTVVARARDGTPPAGTLLSALLDAHD